MIKTNKMATSCGHSKAAITNNVESLLECTVCLETMNDPRTLPCFHSFCKVCLERIVENTREKAKSAKIEDFNCPSCRAVFNLKPNQEVAELSCSHVVRNMLEAVKLQRQAKHANCSKCNKQEASSRCLTCELFLCDECLAEHNSIAKNWPGFRKISCSVLTIEELAKPENQSKIKGNGASYCEKHQGKKLKFYCETCKEIICRYCMDFIHTRQDHKCEPIEHVVEKRKESLMRSINAFEKKLVSGNEALLAICDVEAKFQSNAEEVKKFVNEEKESVKDMLLQCLAENARKKHDEINELYEKNQNAIVQQKNEIESFVSDLNTSYYVAKKVAKAGTAVELIESAGMAEEKLRSIERKEKTKLTKAINYGDIVMEYEKIREDDVKKLQKLLKLGNVKVISPEKQEKYRKIKAVGEPIVHRESGQAQGSWMRDPLGLLGPEKIWYMEGYEGSTVLEFENMDNFKAGWVAKTYDLPIQYGFDGTGSVVYGRYLYYNRSQTGMIVQYDLVHEKVIRETTPYKNIDPRLYPYQWGGYSGMDLSIDENGLWALYALPEYNGRLCASQLDPSTLGVLNTFCNVSPKPIKNMGNAFVACGVVYSIDDYNASQTTINYAYNTTSKTATSLAIPFVNKFGYNSMVTYNPREKVLYSWDSGHQITYPLEFED